MRPAHAPNGAPEVEPLRAELAASEVIDSGAGMAEADQPRLFKRFSQLPGGLEKGNGSGLGLSIRKALIEAHGAGSACSAGSGEGSTFWFEVPVDPAVPTA